MSAPDLRHARWCSDPAVTRTGDALDRARTWWHCLTCGARAVVIGAAPETTWTEVTR